MFSKTNSGALAARSALDLLRRARFGVTAAALGCAVLSLIGCTVVLALQVRSERVAVAERLQLNSRIRHAARVTDLLSDAETAQRGLLLTGKQRYLAPYNLAVDQLPHALAELHAASAKDLEVRVHVRLLEELTDLKLSELAKTISLYEQGRREAAIALVQTDAGQSYMEKARWESAEVIHLIEARRDASSLQVLGSNLAVKRWAILTVTALLLLTAIVVWQVRTLLRTVATSEERFRLMAVHSQDVITTSDAQGRWTYISPSVEHLVGFAPEELLGQRRFDFVHADDVHILEQQSDSARMLGTVRARHKAGHYVWVEVLSRRVTRGDAVTWVTNVRDVSERKRLDQIKSDFISTVNHELRTPLTSILGSIGLAASGKAGAMDDSVGRLLNIAKSNCDRLAQLINDVLDFEKVASGNMQFDLTPCVVDDFIARSIAAIAPYAQKYKVSMRARHKVPGTQIAVDACRFDQVMANLLSNAAKFSNPGGAVDIDAAVVHGRCRISVVDRGCGIPHRFQKSLFERFTQAESSDARARGGTGLGMAIAKQMTEGMGGTITFESKEGVGTTFHLEFAVAVVAAAALEACA